MIESKANAGGVLAVAFGPQGMTLASRDFRCIKLWDVASKKNTATMEASAVPSLAFNPDGQTLATGDAFGTVCIRELASRKITATLPGYMDSGVLALAFRPEGQVLEAVRLCDMASGRTIATLCGSLHFGTFSPDGKSLAAWRWPGDVRFWDTTTGK